MLFMQIESLEDYERRMYDRIFDHVDPIAFKDLKMPNAPRLAVIDADTYKPYDPLSELFPVAPSMYYEGGVTSPTGKYRFRRSILAHRQLLTIPFREGRRPAYVGFTDHVLIPILRELKFPNQSPPKDEITWMSTTPAELLSQRSGVRAARGEVVIGGLGMGWFLHEVAQRKQVKKITIVEKDEELIAWYGNALAKKYNAEIVCADIYDVYRDFSKETRFLLDIWPAWFDATGDRKLRKMRAEGFNVWAWGSPRGLES